MKKRIRKLTVKYVRRVGALFSTVCLLVSLMMPFASAASDTEADMPSVSDFAAHRGSWFVWRKVVLGGFLFYELTGDPILSSSSPYSLPTAAFYSTSAFNVSVSNGTDTSAYGCAFPSPLHSYTGFWSDLPSFRVGRGVYTTFPSSVLRCYSTYSSSFDNVFFVFLTPAFSSSSSVISDFNSDDSGYSSRDLASFSSPLFSYPFAYRSYSSSIRSSYSLQGGDSSFVMPSLSSSRHFNLSSSRQLVGYSDFRSFSSSYTALSSDLGVIFAKKPDTSYTIVDAADFNTSFSCVFTLCVPVDLLPDVEVGDWISDSPEDLQDTLTNEFGVDSGKLKDSKNSITDWSNSESIDSIASDTALGFFGGLMSSGLAPCFVVVALLCFGAIMLHILLRKALD